MIKCIIIGMQLIFLINGIYLIGTGEWMKGLGLIGSLLLTFVPFLYGKLTKVKIPKRATMWYVLFIFCCQWLGTYLRFYDTFVWWDVLLHFTSGILMGYVGIVVLVTLDRECLLFKAHKVWLIALFAFSISIVGAVIWEIIEFGSDTLFGSFTQLGSLQDTMIDLILGTLGAILFAGYLIIRLRKKKSCCIDPLITCYNKMQK